MKDASVIDAIMQRRSVRIYKTEPFAMSELTSLVEAGRWAPSAGNSQPWEFLLINDEDIVNGLKSVSPGWLRDAPALIVICLNKNRETEWSYIDIGGAMQNILLYGHSKGYGCCPIGGFVVETVKELLELPSHLEPVLFITVGHSEENPSAVNRMTTEELIFRKVGK